MRQEIITFSPEEMAQFRDASHDCNPLHCSELYARKSPFGEPVVFGVLGLLASLGHMRPRPQESIARLSVEFRDALVVGVPYQLDVDDRGDTTTLTLRDGRRTLLFASAGFRAGAPSSATLEALPAPSREPVDRSGADLVPELSVGGRYAPSPPAFYSLIQRYGLTERGFGTTEVSALCLASFLVGMELPGRRAMFSRFVFDEIAGGAPHIDYRAQVVSFDDRFDLLRSRGELSYQGRPLGRLTIESFVRADVTSPVPPPPSETWKGKVALVVGGSRGLGAALAQSLAWQGCAVFITYLKSRAEAEALASGALEAPGAIVPIQGDAGDLADCQRVREMLMERGRPLDLLVCSAFPPLRSLWLEDTATERIVRYVADSVRMVSHPMATFLPSLAERRGQLTLISSIAVNTAPTDWPHYVSAKLATEGLVRVAAREYGRVSFFIARPPRLWTDMTNTPLGRQRTLPVDRVALAIVARLATPSALGTVDVLEQFDS